MSADDTAMDDPLAMVAMTIILHAGDARSLVRQAYQALADGTGDVASAHLDRARDEIRQAHQAQTDLIQAEAGGVRQNLTLLFSHAQDTLMTINSEVITAGHLLAIFENVERRLAVLEAVTGLREEEA